MKALITGGAGFIGSHLTDALLAAGHEAAVFDNFSTGREGFLNEAKGRPGFALKRGDLLDRKALEDAAEGRDIVFHFAAHADVRRGAVDPRRDLEQNTIGTSNVLEAMRARGVSRIAFVSTGSVYGEPEIFPTPENAPFPVQTSFYGASKLAGEALIQAYAHSLGFTGWIFRTVSVLGERYSHGHVMDFYRQLREHPSTLHVLGDGRQRKSYVYVGDFVSGVLAAVESLNSGVHMLNLGTDEDCTVADCIGWMTAELGLKPALTYAGGARGWPGDSPHIRLDSSRLRALGWRPSLGIKESHLRTLRYLVAAESK